MVVYSATLTLRYNHTPVCHYEMSELNFALHVRLGDRKTIEPVTAEYFGLLESFMETVAKGVEKMGHATPAFHVFSETLSPCPSADTGTFHEFPEWPVKADQVCNLGLEGGLGFCDDHEYPCPSNLYQ